MDVSHGKWVSSVQDDKARELDSPISFIHTLGVVSNTACAALSLLSDDGEVKLIVAHAGSRYDTWLKVFKGVALVSESRLADLPVAICPFQNEQVISSPWLPERQRIYRTVVQQLLSLRDPVFCAIRT